MFGDAVPVRYSKRIHKKSMFSPIKAKKKVRRPAVKKRAHGINSSLYKITEKTKVGRTSNPESIHQESRKNFVKTGKQKLTKASLNSSKISLPLNEVPLPNPFLDLSDKKKNSKKLVGIKTSERQNLRGLKSTKERGRRKEVSHCDIKSSKARKPSQKKSIIQVINSSSKSILPPNPGTFTPISKHSDRKKSTRLKCSEIIKSSRLSQEPIPTMVSKSFTVTPVIKKVPRTSRHSENRKSGSLSQESILETPHPEEHPGIRLSEPGLSNTLNNESFSAPASLPRMNSNSTIANSSKSSKSAEIVSSKNHSRKPRRPKLSKKEIPTNSHEKLKPKRRRQISQHQKISENPKKSLSKETEKLSLDVLTTPVFRPIRLRTLSKISNEDISINSHEKFKPKRGRSVSQNKKNSKNQNKPLSNEIENLPFDVLTTPAFRPMPIRNLSKNYSSKSNPESLKTPFDILATSAFKSTRTLSKSDPKSSKGNSKVSSSKIHVVSDDLQDAMKKKSTGSSNIPGKGTLKRKRWLLNNLKQTNECYEDDLYENHSFNFNKSFHLDESDGGSSVNIATPKFDCIMTPALPKKTPRFKDCISPTELLQARKTAEEYLYRRNKKRKSGDRPSSSGKKALKKQKTNMNKKKTVQDIPEKKKLDFEEAVNKLIEVQKNLEIDAEVDNEDEDSYFSDASN